MAPEVRVSVTRYCAVGFLVRRPLTGETILFEKLPSWFCHGATECDPFWVHLSISCRQRQQ